MVDTSMVIMSIKFLVNESSRHSTNPPWIKVSGHARSFSDEGCPIYWAWLRWPRSVISPNGLSEGSFV